jgi:heme exporter protein A
VFGFDLQDGLALRQHMHLMGHQHALYADLTVRENLEFALNMYPHADAFKWFPAAQQSGITAALERVSMQEAQHKRIRQLSAGMRKRTMLARMLLIPSPVVLIDEPFANLDLEGKKLVQNLLLEQREAGRTLIVSSHEPELTQHLGTQNGTLEGGVLHIL